jgi:hypothetical protein
VNIKFDVKIALLAAVRVHEALAMHLLKRAGTEYH